MENAIIAFSTSTASVCVRKSCEKLEEIAPICCLTEEIVDDPQNLIYHYVKSHEFSVYLSEISLKYLIKGKCFLILKNIMVYIKHFTLV